MSKTRIITIFVLCTCAAGAAIWVNQLSPVSRALLYGAVLGCLCGFVLGFALAAFLGRSKHKPIYAPERPVNKPERPVMVISPRPGEGPEIRWPIPERWTPVAGPDKRKFTVIGEDLAAAADKYPESWFVKDQRKNIPKG